MRYLKRKFSSEPDDAVQTEQAALDEELRNLNDEVRMIRLRKERRLGELRDSANPGVD